MYKDGKKRKVTQSYKPQLDKEQEKQEDLVPFCVPNSAQESEPVLFVDDQKDEKNLETDITNTTTKSKNH